MNYLRGAFFIDKRHAAEAKKAQKDLSLSQLDIFKKNEEKFDMWVDMGTHIAVPRLYGESLGLDYKDMTSKGHPFTGAIEPVLRDYQVPFAAKIESALRRHKCLTAKAYTGSGKTIIGLEIARRLNTNVLVIVDLERLMLQWESNAKEVFGMPGKEIGKVQGTTVQYKGKSVVIAMAQTLFSRDMGDEFYDNFGMCIWDESKVAGAPIMSSILMRVNSRYRLGLDATPHRKDVFEKVLRYQLGEVSVRLEKQHKKSVVRVVESPAVYSWYANVSSTTGRYINEVAENPERCFLLAEIIKRLANTGRPTLGLSDRVEHLYIVASICRLIGVPREDIGVYAGQTYEWGYIKDPAPKRKPAGYERNTMYTPVKIGVAVRKTKLSEGTRIINKCHIILATYGVFGKGIDVPRLAAGVELTPKSAIAQAHGRTLRKHPGKKTPIWVTVRDVNSFRAEHQLARRLREYVEASNAEVKLWKLDEKKLVSLDPAEFRRTLAQSVRRLKAVDFITGKDGRLTKQTRPTGRLSRSESRTPITKESPHRRPR